MVPQNGWFIMENGVFPYFCKHPYAKKSQTSNTFSYVIPRIKSRMGDASSPSSSVKVHPKLPQVQQNRSKKMHKSTFAMIIINNIFLPARMSQHQSKKSIQQFSKYYLCHDLWFVRSIYLGILVSKTILILANTCSLSQWTLKKKV